MNFLKGVLKMMIDDIINIMKNRLFISIPIPEDVREELICFQEKMDNLDVGWEKPENFHLTLIFFGDTEEGDVVKIKEITERIAQETSPFIIDLNRIVLGPNLSYPRMVWAVGETTFELEKIEKELKENFTRSDIFFDKRHPFKVHLTLARARMNLIPGRVDEKINLSFSVKEINLMESQLSRKGAEHSLLERYPLRV